MVNNSTSKTFLFVFSLYLQLFLKTWGLVPARHNGSALTRFVQCTCNTAPIHFGVQSPDYFIPLLCPLYFINTPATQGRNPYYENDEEHSDLTPSTSIDDSSESIDDNDLNPSQDDAQTCPASDDVQYV